MCRAQTDNAEKFTVRTVRAPHSRTSDWRTESDSDAAAAKTTGTENTSERSVTVA